MTGKSSTQRLGRSMAPPATPGICMVLPAAIGLFERQNPAWHRNSSASPQRSTILKFLLYKPKRALCCSLRRTLSQLLRSHEYGLPEFSFACRNLGPECPRKDCLPGKRERDKSGKRSERVACRHQAYLLTVLCHSAPRCITSFYLK